MIYRFPQSKSYLTMKFILGCLDIWMSCVERYACYVMCSKSKRIETLFLTAVSIQHPLLSNMLRSGQSIALAVARRFAASFSGLFSVLATLAARLFASQSSSCLSKPYRGIVVEVHRQFEDLYTPLGHASGQNVSQPVYKLTRVSNRIERSTSRKFALHFSRSLAGDS